MRILLLVVGIALLLNASAQKLSATDYLLEAKRISDNELDKIDSLLALAVVQATQEKNDSLAAEIHYYQGKVYNRNSFYEDAAEEFVKCQKISHQLHLYYLESKTFRALSNNYLDVGEYDKAIEYGLLAIDLAPENDFKLISNNYSSLAEIYRIWDNYELAIKYNKTALQYALQSNDENAIGKVYSNLSAVLGEIGRNQEAIDSLKVGLSYLSESNYFGKGKMNSNIGFVYRNLGQYKKAIDYHRIALSNKRKTGDNSIIGYSLGAIGRAYLGLQQYDSAYFYIQQELDSALVFNDVYDLKDGTAHLVDYYEAVGDYENAFKLYKKRKSIEDSLFSATMESRANLLQRKYDLTKKESEIQALKQQSELDNINTQIRIVILIALLIFSILMVVIFRIRIHKKEQEKKLVEMQLAHSKKAMERDQKALASFTSDLMLKNKTLRELKENLQAKEQEIHSLKNLKSEELEKLSELKILTEADWRKFKLLFDRVHPQFFKRLNGSTIRFTKGEVRLLALLKLNMDNKEIADTLGISSESVSKSKFRLKKKLEENEIVSIENLVFN